MAMDKKTWGGLPPAKRAGIMAVGGAQLLLLMLAQRDISRRPAELVRGPRMAWRLASLVNIIGPLSYFVFGRLRVPANRAG